MYQPAVFSQTDPQIIERFVDHHPFATLALVIDGRPYLDHMPFRRTDALVRGGKLIAHVSKSNPTWKAADSPVTALLAFTGASAYVSPSLYPSKAVTHEVVPTWNYVSIHMRGVLRCSHDRNEKRRVVDALTRQMEASRDQPWSIDDAPTAYIDKMLDGIVALSFEIEGVDAKFKASQNRTLEDRHGVAQGLSIDPSTGEAGQLVATTLGVHRNL